MYPVPSYDLRHLGFARFAPPAALAPYIQCYWLIRNRSSPLPPRTEKLYPDGGTGLIFNFGAPYTVDRTPVDSRLVYQGAGDRLQGMGLNGSIDAIGIRFRPAGAYPLLGGMPARELQHSWLPLDHLLPETAPLFERLVGTPTPAQRLRLINQWLLRRLTLFERQPTSILPLIDTLAGPHSAVSSLARSSGISRRRLERLFSQQAGLAPARLGLLLKVSRARETLKADFLTPLTDIGQACGFYDQAHFIRHFKTIMQVTPGQYRQHKRRQHTLAQTYNSCRAARR
ncbi:AraC family transcriptional regulator [Exilibacterium tricleocarpae]|uniref:AraC family transcriptional regulator n=1 Tax=Exilibacterium tricleocarpae TaxID=2591008 RepID=A0A545TS42_9GAMM|nr:helix-turn-helix domain-containing protein [Exilibacterium tricleocarpae]TQV80036.1 AraC family transcriptional regulator [Exilibacterium tricleocarpae]